MKNDLFTTVFIGGKLPCIDGDQPWRRTFGENITDTDWSRDNYFHAERKAVSALMTNFNNASG